MLLKNWSVIKFISTVHIFFVDICILFLRKKDFLGDTVLSGCVLETWKLWKLWNYIWVTFILYWITFKSGQSWIGINVTDWHFALAEHDPLLCEWHIKNKGSQPCLKLLFQVIFIVIMCWGSNVHKAHIADECREK